MRELFGLAPLPPTPPPEQMTAEEARELAREVNKKMVMKIAGTVVTVAGQTWKKSQACKQCLRTVFEKIVDIFE